MSRTDSTATLGTGHLKTSVRLWESTTASTAYRRSFFDYDRDGDADLYLSTDKGYYPVAGNRLFENVGGTFSDVTESSGTEAYMDSMGIAVGDFDGNGFPDLYCTNIPQGNPLFLNQGNGTFVESAEIAGVVANTSGWAAIFVDYDNDGHQDLYVCNELVLEDLTTPNLLYVHDGSWPCVEVAVDLSTTAPGQSFGMAAADIDDDGDIDFAIQNNFSNILLLINHEGETRSWIKYRVVGQGANTFGIGAVVNTRTADVWRIREVSAGGNYKSQNEMTLHVGLGDAVIVDEVSIMWPGGTTRTLTGLVAKMTWPLYPPERLGDADGDGDRDVDDIGAFLDVALGQDDDIDRFARSDMNGDGRVDGRDLPLFVAALLP